MARALRRCEAIELARRPTANRRCRSSPAPRRAPPAGSCRIQGHQPAGAFLRRPQLSPTAPARPGAGDTGAGRPSALAILGLNLRSAMVLSLAMALPSIGYGRRGCRHLSRQSGRSRKECRHGPWGLLRGQGWSGGDGYRAARAASTCASSRIRQCRTSASKAAASGRKDRPRRARSEAPVTAPIP